MLIFPGAWIIIRLAVTTIQTRKESLMITLLSQSLLL